MSYSARLIHTLTVERKLSDPDVEDAYGQPVISGTATFTINGLPQPKRVAEVAAISQAGLSIGDWTVFTEAIDLSGGDAIIHDKDVCPVVWPRDLPDMRFELTGTPRNAAGIGHHLEADAKVIQSAGEFAVGS